MILEYSKKYCININMHYHVKKLLKEALDNIKRTTKHQENIIYLRYLIIRIRFMRILKKNFM